MLINDLKPKQSNFEINAEVIEKESPREFEKFGKKGKVCNAKIKDESGIIKLTLWNEEIDMIKVGDLINIKNGYVSEWNNEKQISIGKFGTMIINNEDNEIEQELDQLEKQDKDIEKLSKIEKEIKDENIKNINDLDYNNLDQEKKDFEKLEKDSYKKDLIDVEDEIENIKDNENKNNAITLDELEEAKIIDNIEDEKEEYDDNEDLSTDFVEEDVIDEEKKE